MTVTDGHMNAVEWMATPEFRETVGNHREACGDDVDIYFRPTDKGIVRIALCSEAPSYVGFRVNNDEEGYILKPGSVPPSVADIKARLCKFRTWITTVGRSSEEEQGVIRWLKAALSRNLLLPDIGAGWVFLHQEWRFLDDAGKGKKSDVLVVHAPTGQLGIVEFKSDKAELDKARKQVDEYARYWRRDAAGLAPFFTKLLQAIGAAYSNPDVAQTTVITAEPSLFVGVAHHRTGTQVWRHR